MSTLTFGGCLRMEHVGPLVHRLLDHGFTRIIHAGDGWVTIKDFQSYVGCLYHLRNQGCNGEAFYDGRLNGDATDDLESHLKEWGVHFRLTLETEKKSLEDCDIWHPGMSSIKACVFSPEDASVYLNSIDIRRLMKKPPQLKQMVDDLEQDIPALQIV